MRQTGLRIRTATLSDDAELARLDASAWSPEVEVVPPNSSTTPFFTGFRPPHDVIVACEDHSIAGYAHLARHIPIPKNKHVLHLNALVVAPHQRGRGISHQLVDAAIDEARQESHLRYEEPLGRASISVSPAAMSVPVATPPGSWMTGGKNHAGTDRPTHPYPASGPGYEKGNGGAD